MSERSPGVPGVDVLAPEVRISRAVSRILREATGRGAENVWTTIADDHVVVMLAGTLTAVERALIESGHDGAVTTMRLAVQDLLRDRASRAVEDATGRRVEGFMSANSFAPDRAVEVFLLAGERPGVDEFAGDRLPAAAVGPTGD